eukprot:2520527-Amphidinium_carterae.1
MSCAQFLLVPVCCHRGNGIISPTNDPTHSSLGQHGQLASTATSCRSKVASRMAPTFYQFQPSILVTSWNRHQAA